MSAENGIYFKHYMRYLLVLSPKYSLQGLLEKYYSAKEFIRFLENRNGSLSEISYPDIESYINWKDASNCSPVTYNNALTRLSFFLTCLHTREHLLVPSFPFEHFYKKAYYLHHDRVCSRKHHRQDFYRAPGFSRDHWTYIFNPIFHRA